MKILMIDDDEAPLRALARAIQAFGHDVFPASNGQAALQILDEQPLDLVITDIEMPGIDGFGVLNAVKRLHPALPVIVVTGYSNKVRAIRAVNEGAFAFLEKPVALLELEQKIEEATRLLSARQSEQKQVEELHEVARGSRVALAKKDRQLVETNRLLAVIERISQSVLASLDLDQILDNLTHQIVEVGVFRSLMVALVDEEAQSVVIERGLYLSGSEGSREESHVKQATSQLGLRSDLGDRNITAQVARTGQMAVIEGWDDRFDSQLEDPESCKGKVSYFIPVKKDGRVLAVLATGSRLEDKTEILHRIQMLQPLLDQVAVAIAHGRLYQEAQQRTAELRDANAQLRAEITRRRQMESQLEAQRVQAMQADRLQALGEMAAGVVHELGQPLGAILATAEGLGLRMENGLLVTKEKVMGAVEDIMGFVDRMADTLEHLRVFSRDTALESATRFSLNEALEAGLRMVGVQFKNHDIALRLDLDEALPSLTGHAQQVEQVFLNLLANARDALDERAAVASEPDAWQKEIHIRSCLEQTESPHVVFEIHDNGIGIDPSLGDRVFEPFFTTKEPNRGTGLGLAISYGIVQKMGGQITYSSSEGNGTTFRVRMPVERSEA